MLVKAVRPRCPACESTNRGKKYKAITYALTGQHDGKRYDSVQVCYVKCRDCGQTYCIKEFLVRNANQDTSNPMLDGDK